MKNHKKNAYNKINSLTQDCSKAGSGVINLLHIPVRNNFLLVTRSHNHVDEIRNEDRIEKSSQNADCKYTKALKLPSPLYTYLEKRNAA
jgi:hypothetical protein